VLQVDIQGSPLNNQEALELFRIHFIETLYNALRAS
jgi:hypothetical protein